MIILYIILALLAAFIAVILIRTALFKPESKTSVTPENVEFDKEGAVNGLAELVKCRTVSNCNASLEDDEEFEKLISKLPELYPNVFKNCKMDRLKDRALLIHWQGKTSDEPAVLMSHYDVVPVDESQWEKPPFAAVIEDGVLWGRGTLDTKVTMNAALYAADNLIEEGFIPEHDIYFAFSGGEEINGDGAKNIVDWFEANNIVPGIVVDEGGGVVDNVFPGIKEPCALIGIAEKGMMNLEYAVSTDGGHASAPPVHTPIGKLSAACTRVEAKPFKMHITKPVLEMFDTLGRHSTFLYRIIFANLWCFKGLLGALSKKSGGEMNALLRTTVAFTQMSGSPASNVLPTRAYMVSNSRLNPEDSLESAMQYIKSAVKDDSIEIKRIGGMEPSRISRTDCEAWQRITKAVNDTWDGCLIAPYLMVQCSDSRHYGRISDKVYRFSAMDITSDERKTIHGNNERIRVEAIYKSVEFYMRLIKQC